MMASITDCVVEGLKYPFNDVKKLLGFGVLFAVLNLLGIARGAKSIDIVRAFSKAPGDTMMFKFSQMPQTDIGIMIVLAIISFIVMLFIMGYQYNVVKFSIDKKDDLPGFNDIAGMLIKGIKYFIVVLAYTIIPALLMIGGVFGFNESYGLILIFISSVLFIIAYFLLIMALNNMIAHDELAKAFDFKEITGKISNLGWGKYIGTILFTIIVFMIIMVAVGFILSLLTAVLAIAVNQALILSAIVGVIEGVIVNSYAGVFYNRVLGSIYRESIK